MMVTREDIVREALTLVGCRYRHRGRNEHGIDCVGVPIVVAWRLGLMEEDVRDYPDRPDGSLLDRFEEAGCRRISPLRAQHGDILIFAERGTRCHCGIMVEHYGEPGVVHGHLRRRKVMKESLKDAQSFVSAPTHAFIFPGIE